MHDIEAETADNSVSAGSVSGLVSEFLIWHRFMKLLWKQLVINFTLRTELPLSLTMSTQFLRASVRCWKIPHRRAMLTS